jgi:hypothetical protein
VQGSRAFQQDPGPGFRHGAAEGVHQTDHDHPSAYAWLCMGLYAFFIGSAPPTGGSWGSGAPVQVFQAAA